MTKSEVEQLLARYDTDPRAALTTALRVVLARPDATWTELLTDARLADRREALLTEQTDALDELVRDLNERRTLPPTG